jgi:hypothetical protein
VDEVIERKGVEESQRVVEGLRKKVINGGFTIIRKESDGNQRVDG